MNREEVQSLALNALIENNGGTIVMSPGTGKSKVAIDFIKNNNFNKILITSPRTNLKSNWKKELEEWGISTQMVGAEGENEPTHYWLDYSKAPGKNWRSVDIFYENIQTCYKWSDEELSKYDLIIMDEIHTMATDEYGNLARNAKRLNITSVGLTGTPDDRKADKQLFYAFNCPIVYRYLDSAKDGIINKRKYIVYEHVLTDAFQVEVKAGSKKWMSGEKKQYNYIQSKIKEGEDFIKDILGIDRNTEEYVNYFGWAKKWYWNSDDETSSEMKKAGGTYMRAISARTDLLWNLTSTRILAKQISHHITHELKEKVLVFSERTDQATKISQHTVHSKNKDEVNAENIKKFDNGEIKQLGSCYSLTLGLNLKDAKYAIMESFNGSDVQFKQRSGRVDRLPVDDNAIVIFLVVKDTQSETWFKQSVKFDEHDDVFYTSDPNELIKNL